MKLRNSGFTMIELMVVITIIGILSAIILASLNNAKKNANDTRIMQNLVQMRNLMQLSFDGQYYDGIINYMPQNNGAAGVGWPQGMPRNTDLTSSNYYQTSQGVQLYTLIQDIAQLNGHKRVTDPNISSWGFADLGVGYDPINCPFCGTQNLADGNQRIYGVVILTNGFFNSLTPQSFYNSKYAIYVMTNSGYACIDYKNNLIKPGQGALAINASTKKIRESPLTLTGDYVCM